MKRFCKKPARHASIWVICTGSAEHAAYVLLSRWLSISGILYPSSMVHSLLMAHYVKYCALIMPKSAHDDPKHRIIHFVSPVILYCRIRQEWIQRHRAITHLSISRLRVFWRNKTAIVWTICFPFPALMSRFTVWRSRWSRTGARCCGIMGLFLCVPVISSPATLNEEAIWRVEAARSSEWSEIMNVK